MPNIFIFILTCEANSRNTKSDDGKFMILFVDSSHQNWLQYREIGVDLNVIGTKYCHGYHELYRNIISKNKCEAPINSCATTFMERFNPNF